MRADACRSRFGTLVDLQTSDFEAAANVSDIGTFGATPASGWYSANLIDTAFPYIHLGGATQFRLRFSTDDNNDLGADFMDFYSGDAGAANQPVLTITYYVP